MQPPSPSGAYSDQWTDDRSTQFVIRPDASTFWRGVGFRGLIFLPLVALAIYRAAGRNGLAWPVLLYGGLALVLAVGAITIVETTSVVLTTTTVAKHRRWLPPSVLPRAAVASGVLVRQYRSAFNRTAPLLVLVGETGRPVLRLTGQVFTGPDLFAFAERFGPVYFDVVEGVAGPKEVGGRHPRLLPLVERRPGLLIIAGTVLLLAAVVVGVSVFDPGGS